jgi:hypothetical protein
MLTIGFVKVTHGYVKKAGLKTLPSVPNLCIFSFVGCRHFPTLNPYKSNHTFLPLLNIR